MSIKMELIGKTISGVVAARDSQTGRHRIWLLQFTDGTHVEFVSPAARRRLERQAGACGQASRRRVYSPQLSLNVA